MNAGAPGPDSLALVVVAHPDDAEIAVGGTIARLRSEGVRVVVAMLTFPEGGAGGAMRIRHVEQAAAVLDYEPRYVGDPEQQQVTDLAETDLVRRLDELMAELKPRAVLTHWPGDGHVDHRQTARAVAASLRHHRADLYAFRPSESRVSANVGFAPTVFVDITAFATVKAKALAPFTQSRPGFRAVNGIAAEVSDKYFGSLSGTDYAEAFEVRRQHGLGAVMPEG